MVRHTVLIVDDLADSADTLSTLLDLCGFDCEAQFSGAAALASVCRRRPDIVLLDVRMPQMDGFEFVRLLREIEGCRRTPVVVISGFHIAASRVQARVFGIDCFLAKPVVLQDLLNAMEELLADPVQAEIHDCPLLAYC